jgi:predicted metal-dependent hydrolase
MKRDISVIGYILIIFTVGVILRIYLDSDAFNLKCIVSDVDGKKYCVRERSKMTLVVDLLAKTTQKLSKLVKYVGKKYPDRENCKLLLKNFNPKKISEILPTSQYTAYSENKGEKLAFCTTTSKKGDRLIDENTLMFVALHELSHIATTSIGHTQEFWRNFKFIITNAKKIGIYDPENYKKNPKVYCGLQINDNPYFDL